MLDSTLEVVRRMFLRLFAEATPWDLVLCELSCPENRDNRQIGVDDLPLVASYEADRVRPRPKFKRVARPGGAEVVNRSAHPSAACRTSPFDNEPRQAARNGTCHMQEGQKLNAENPPSHQYGGDEAGEARDYTKKQPKQLNNLCRLDVSLASDTIRNLPHPALGSGPFVRFRTAYGEPGLRKPAATGTHSRKYELMTGNADSHLVPILVHLRSDCNDRCMTGTLL
jgi:hypothetical protein